MNRKERRIAVARGQPIAAARADTARLFAEANQAYRAGHFERAEALCRQIEACAPSHARSLNLLGLINQARGRHRPAVKIFAQAIAVDGYDAACHYNIASSYQLLHERAAAATHFNKAIALGLNGQDVGDLLLQNPIVADAVRRAMDELPDANGIAFDRRQIEAIGNDVFLQCALQSTLICGLRFEFLLTRLRRMLLQFAVTDAPDQAGADPTEFFCALAQQCFISEYVFLQTDEETARAAQLRQLLMQKLSDGLPVSPILIAAVAAYYPLGAIAGTQTLLAAEWPDFVTALLRQQISEPFAEAEDRRTIPALTAVDDATSLEVRQQYEENPYPRWTNSTAAAPVDEMAADGTANGSGQADGGFRQTILIAACGTGRHAVDVAQCWPQAEILAVDLSRASLAYARKKTREARVGNIEYAQADILKLGEIGRSFDRIEAIGVLHHLADPKAGWRVLLSLLKPGGRMRVGLYSESARRAIVGARAVIAERGYPPTAEGIRALRQTIIADRDREPWRQLLDTSADFYCTSGCRDLFFNVMEHRFTIPEIERYLAELDLSFHGFDLDPATTERFRRQYPGATAWTNLAHWHTFETAYPDTFRRMYVFEVSKRT